MIRRIHTVCTILLLHTDVFTLHTAIYALQRHILEHSFIAEAGSGLSFQLATLERNGIVNLWVGLEDSCGVAICLVIVERVEKTCYSQGRITPNFSSI